MKLSLPTAFYTHVAVVAASVGSGSTAMFDANFLNAHPRLAALVVVVSGIAIAVSQAFYMVASAKVHSSPAFAGDGSIIP